MRILEPWTIIWRSAVVPYWPWLVAAAFSAVVLRAASVASTCWLDSSLSCGEHASLAAFGWLRFQWTFKYKELIGAVIAAGGAIAVLRPAFGQMRAAATQAAVATAETLEEILSSATLAREAFGQCVNDIALLRASLAGLKQGERLAGAAIRDLNARAARISPAYFEIQQVIFKFSGEKDIATSRALGALFIIGSMVEVALSDDSRREMFAAARERRPIDPEVAMTLDTIENLAVTLPEFAPAAEAALRQIELLVRAKINEQHHILLR